MRLLPVLALTLALFTGCRMGMVPHSPRVARSEGHALELRSVRTTMQLADGHAAVQRVELLVRALPEGTSVNWVALTETYQEPCSDGTEALRVAVQGRSWSSPRWLPKPGETLLVDFSADALKQAMAGPSRLDLWLEDRDGLMKCASFPFVGEGEALRWDAAEMWTLNLGLDAAFFHERIDGLNDNLLVPLEVGRWLGPVRVFGSAAVGSVGCDETLCTPVEQDQGKPVARRGLHLAGALGGEMTLLQLGSFAFDLKAQYRLGWARAKTREGQREWLLHGPALAPALALTLPPSMAPGVPGGTRRGYAITWEAPIGYVMSSRGGSAFSFGVGLMFLLNLR